ncbi:MAG: tRNA pseudouridine38-40 synthase [Dasania sp.]|jgi:tRNA pseudouridine38-40 synthase
MIQRYKAIVEYEGTFFHGWQAQDRAKGYGFGVQNSVEDALFKLYHQKIPVICAGRTDAGVHAKGQVIHFDAPKTHDDFKIIGALNYHLKPHPVCLLSLESIDSDFHARFDAISREYEYHIINRKALLTFMHHRAWLVMRPLNLQAMQEAAQAFVGTHDLTTFRARGCQANSPIRTIYSVDIEQVAHDHFIMRTLGQSFLYNQIRSMVGSLVKIGIGQETVCFIDRILKAKDRTQCGVVAPPYGLYFNRVNYA